MGQRAQDTEGAACSACLCDVLMVFCHSNTTFLAKNVIKTLLGMRSKLCCIRRTNQNGKLVDNCFVWTTFICWIPEVFASISHMSVLPWDACASIKLWHSPTEVFLKHLKHSSTLAVELCWRDELSGRTHVLLQYLYLGPNYPHGSLLAVFIPFFLGHDLPCVAMELLFGEREFDMAETVRNQMCTISAEYFNDARNCTCWRCSGLWNCFMKCACSHTKLNSLKLILLLDSFSLDFSLFHNNF